MLQIAHKKVESWYFVATSVMRWQTINFLNRANIIVTNRACRKNSFPSIRGRPGQIRKHKRVQDYLKGIPDPPLMIHCVEPVNERRSGGETGAEY